MHTKKQLNEKFETLSFLPSSPFANAHKHVLRKYKLVDNMKKKNGRTNHRKKHTNEENIEIYFRFS